MANLSWCCKKKNGIKLIEPSDNLAKAYMEMASDAIKVMHNENGKSLRWTISPCYYSMYYSLYAVLQKIGINCEIHARTIELMKVLLSKFYSTEDIGLISRAFDCRNSIQYYVDRVIDLSDSNYIISNAEKFFNKSLQILSKLNQDDIEFIRKNLNNFMP